uniref:ATP-dependent RNA helicase n=1 Tax=Steinernema glaseri TaxID=37863 RepID=A0A1I7ZZK3_9BILA
MEGLGNTVFNIDPALSPPRTFVALDDADKETTEAKKAPKPLDLVEATGVDVRGGDGSKRMFRSLAAAEFPEMMMENLREIDISTATPVQLASFYQMKFRYEYDLIVQSETGSGKTVAYLAPLASLIHNLRICSTKPAPFRPFAIIVLPTRETVLEVAAEARQLTKSVSVSVAMTYGQMDARQTIRDIKFGCDILIGTPDRLLPHIRSGMMESNAGLGGVKLDNFCWLVVDEADSYEGNSDFTELMSILRPFMKRLYVFGTSLSRKIVDGFKTYMKSTPFEISDYQKTIDFEWREVATEEKRIQLLRDLEFLKDFHGKMPKTVVFADKKESCEAICSLLAVHDIHSLVLTSVEPEEKREETLSTFASGKYKVLVCTNIVARGIRFRHLRYIINYDFPDIDTFAYRIMNTNRAGHRERAITYFPRDESDLAKKTIEVLNLLGKRVPHFLHRCAAMGLTSVDLISLD